MEKAGSAPGDTGSSVLTLSLLVVRSCWKVCKMLLVLLLWKLTKNRCLLDTESHCRHRSDARAERDSLYQLLCILSVVR